MSLLQVKKKKKRANALNLEEVISIEMDKPDPLEQMKEDIISIFKSHIGKDNSITARDLFEQVYHIDPLQVDVFKRAYWWNVIKKALRGLRGQEILFTINLGTKLYVLQTQEESDAYKKKINRNIDDMKSLKIKADRWVNKKRWRQF